ncbi:MAG: SusD/RagB family nutrient-binding outer membrane lipoprotein [Saprospiraceae bacterium]|nr:SusD/RagB family nutrient-binding outer membrane lipoprotein [Saprospiraceae bacterium]
MDLKQEKWTMGPNVHRVGISLGLVILLFGFLQCEFDDLNIDPTRQNDASVREILPTAMVQTLRNTLSIGGRVAGTLVQHFEGTEAQPLSYNNYLVDEQTLSDFWETGLYAGAMKDCRIIIDKAIANDQPHYEGIAKVLMAFNLGIATSFWGDVPFSQALLGTESLKSSYDTQEEVYGSILQLLDEAIIAFQKPASIGGPTNDDLIFGGIPDRWIKTCHALKARYLLHLSAKDPSNLAQVLEEVSQAFVTATEQPDLYFGDSDNESNPLALFGKERPQQIEIGVALKNLMENTNDPRRSKYWVEVQDKDEVYLADNTDLIRAQRNSPVPLISLSELLFIQAEALVRTDASNSAQIFTRGIIASMEDCGIIPALYNPYLAFNGGLSSSLSLDEKIGKVINQKFIASYGINPHEAWIDQRRTGYPRLEVPSNANASLNPSLIIPKRVLYPISERTTNYDNYQEAIDRQGGHLMDVTPWLFK